MDFYAKNIHLDSDFTAFFPIRKYKILISQHLHIIWIYVIIKTAVSVLSDVPRFGDGAVF